MKISARNSNIKTSADQGWTLPEFMVAIAIGGLLLAAIAATTVSSVRSFASMYNYTDLDLQSRTALDTMSKDIRGALNVATVSANSLVLNGPAGAVITYTWDGNANTLTRFRKSGSGTTTKTTWTHCNNWNVTMYTKTNSVTTTPSQCKMVSMKWKGTCNVIGTTQTENAQEAVIILRNK